MRRAVVASGVPQHAQLLPWHVSLRVSCETFLNELNEHISNHGELQRNQDFLSANWLSRAAPAQLPEVKCRSSPNKGMRQIPVKARRSKC